MNNRRPNFHFDEGNGFDKRSDIWKRFGFDPQEDRRMFGFDRPPQFDDPEWRNRTMFNEPGSSSPSFGHRMRMGQNWVPDEEIPIRVVHENTPPTMADDGNDSETSSQASHGSHGSSASGSGQPMKAKITREPRVHHIPIMVEPRDGSTSSGYASDGGGGNQANHNHSMEHQSANKQSASGANLLSKQNSVDSNMDTEDYPAPNVQQLKKNFEQGRAPEKRKDSSVRTIPIKVLNENMPPSASASSPKSRQLPGRSFSANCFGNDHTDMPTSPRQRKASSHPPMSSPSTTNNHRPTGPPHVTKIPVNSQHQKREMSPEPSSQNETNSRVKPTPNPLEEIKTVLDELNAYKQQINEFQGIHLDKAYRYLEEMLTRLILKLDNVETNGQDNIRQARKAAVREIESWISNLESRANAISRDNPSMETELVKNASNKELAEDNMAVDHKLDRSESRCKEDSMETDHKTSNSESSLPPTENSTNEGKETLDNSKA